MFGDIRPRTAPSGEQRVQQSEDFRSVKKTFVMSMITLGNVCHGYDFGCNISKAKKEPKLNLNLQVKPIILLSMVYNKISW